MINKCLYNKNVVNFGLSHILIISWQQSGGKISKNVDFPGDASGKESSFYFRRLRRCRFDL